MSCINRNQLIEVMKEVGLSSKLVVLAKVPMEESNS
jgi:hypothetical protein